MCANDVWVNVWKPIFLKTNTPQKVAWRKEIRVHSALHDARSRSFRAKMPIEAGTGLVMRFAKLSEHALAPLKASASAAGFDLKSAYDYVVPARGKELVKTDLQIELPHGCYGRIAPRSGLAWKNFIDVGAGVIDEDYRGNVGVLLFNHSNADFNVARGDRVAQLICERIYYPELEEVSSLSETVRGEGGFGSTGKK